MAALDGDIWFSGRTRIDGATRTTLGRIAISTDGALQLFPLKPHCDSRAVAAGNGGIWFGEFCRHRLRSGRVFQRSSIGRIDPSGTIVRRRIAPGDDPYLATTGRDGSVWFGVSRDSGYIRFSRIVRIAPAGDLAEFRVPNSRPSAGIAVDPGGRLWFASSFGGGVVRALNSIDATGKVGKPICVDPKCELEPEGLASAPDGSIWFATRRAHSLGGGGLSSMMESEAIANEAGFVGRLVP